LPQVLCDRLRSAATRSWGLLLAALGTSALVLLGTACGGGGIGGGAAPTSTFRGSPADGFDAPNFRLRDQSGRVTSLAGQRGRFVLIAFLYTRCPDVCPLIAAELNDVLKRLGNRRDRVRVLAISVDPGGDTSARVESFIRAHRLLPQFRYLTGSREQLEPIWRDYHAAAQVGPPSRSIHSAFELLIDPAGKPQLRYSADVRAADVLHDLLELGLR
jgi:protein SCO1/2